jgi:Mn2+/Fe2+ NRAMP family transporter
MNDIARTNAFNSVSVVRALAVWGPGLLVMLADTDAGNVVAAAQGGALWGYRLLPLVLLLIPMLYLVQELTARLGVFTGRGHAELIRERYGLGWALLAVAGLAAAAIGSLVTELTAVAGVGEMFGLPRSFTLPMAMVALLAIVGAGAYRRVERAAIVIGLFELAFFVVAWAARPSLAAIAADSLRLPFGDREFLYMVAAIIGATFNPWMIFYQQSATVDKRLQPADLRHARIDTAIGAILTQCLTGAVLIAAAAAFAYGEAPTSLSSIGEISGALTPALGAAAGKIIFGAGVLGASLVAAIVASLALAWGVGEVAGYKRTLELHPFAAGWFYGVYALCVTGSALAVWTAADLIWLNVAAQVLNAFLMPLVIGFLVALAATALPEPYRVGGWRLRLIVGICTAVSALGVIGGLQALL